MGYATRALKSQLNFRDGIERKRKFLGFFLYIKTNEERFSFLNKENDADAFKRIQIRRRIPVDNRYTQRSYCD